MSAKGKNLTLARLANHDFHRALRIWLRLLQPVEIVRALVRERGKALAAGLRVLGLAVVLMLWLAANKSELNLSIAFLDLAVPSAYVTFALAFLTFAGLVNVISYFVLNDFVRVAGNAMFRSRTSPALTILEDGSNAWAAGLSRQYRFFESDKRHKSLGIFVAYFINVPFLIVLIALYWTVIGSGIRVIHDHGWTSFETTLIVVGWLLVLYPPIHVALMLVPFRFTKNIGYIRWVFLYRLHMRLGERPPQVNRWLSEDRHLK